LLTYWKANAGLTVLKILPTLKSFLAKSWMLMNSFSSGLKKL
jgi:hypothetical protein